ncbi:hypothetical protein [Hymenobacter guriensis]|uniref:Cupin n=1 Tax=Hymenobacter guriensis TaxID=2793065 RepID=A0ABS0KWX6_9BACT|nr:hypothetical protein [Hymenobacter guriensis]MBG8552372.1 hypothetical protein [Hymenobacter guriensis]
MTLDTFLATYEPQLRELLPFWPVKVWKTEHYGPLTKYTLGPLEDGRWAMLHQLRQADDGAPHDHPCRFDTYVLAGGYRESIYRPGHPTHPHEDVDRRPGAAFTILPDTIHRITGLLAEESWSLCLAGPVVKDWKHYPELLNVDK